MKFWWLLYGIVLIVCSKNCFIINFLVKFYGIFFQIQIFIGAKFIGANFTLVKSEFFRTLEFCGHIKAKKKLNLVGRLTVTELQLLLIQHVILFEVFSQVKMNFSSSGLYVPYRIYKTLFPVEDFS